MKVSKLRSVLVKVAEMQHRQGDVDGSKALERLSETLKSHDKTEVVDLVEGIQQRRADRTTR